MGSEWGKAKLETITTKVGDGLHGTPKYSLEGEYFFINGNNLSNGQIIPNERTKRVNKSEFDKYKKELNDRTILVSINGTLGNVAFYNNEKVVLGKSACYFNLKDDVDKGFIKYSLLDRKFQAHIEQFATGTTIKNVSLKTMRNYEFLLPSLPEQKAIAHILGSLDNKIELNRKMNQTLEAMAQALFKSWFVDFDPVIDNALAAGKPIPEALQQRAEQRRSLQKQPQQKTAQNKQTNSQNTLPNDIRKLFPNAFYYSEELGWVPEGWEGSSFEAIATLDTTSIKPFNKPETTWEHYSIPSYDSSKFPAFDLGSDIKSNKYKIKEGAILSSKLNPATERTWWPLLMDFDVSICSTEFMQFVPNNLKEQPYLYSLIRSDPFQDNILKRVTGSTGSRQRAQPKQIAQITILDCKEELRNRYIIFTKSIFEKINAQTTEIMTLSKLRDTLLPKLISGELRIPDAEKLIEKI